MARWWMFGWGLLSVCVAGCTPVQFDRERHAALVAPHHLGEGDTGKPPVGPEAEKTSVATTGRATTGAQPEGESTALVAPDAESDEGAEDETWIVAKKALKGGFLPDPPPRVSRHQWVFDVHYERGAVRVDFAETLELDEAAATPRLVGRFALEFWIGNELLERVRFDFPLLGDEAGDPTLQSSISLAPGAQTHRRVQVARVPRATWAQLVDRATGKIWRLPWPPEALEPTLDEPTGP